MTTTTTHPASAEPLDAVERPCPGGHDPAAAPAGQPVWCLDCEQRIAEALAPPHGYWAKLGIADLVARVASRRDGRLPEAARPAARAVRASGHASVSPGWDEVDYVTRWATERAMQLAVALGHPTTPDDDVTARHLPQLEWALAYLHRHLRLAMTHAGAQSFGTEVLREHRRLQRLAGEQDLSRRVRTPCPSCDTLGVVREDGQDRVQCVTCGAHWTEATFQTALQRAAVPAPRAPRERRRRSDVDRQLAPVSRGGRA